MITDLTDANASTIASALVSTRRQAGSPAMGMVMTLVVVAEEDECLDAMAAASDAAKEHPSRILGVVLHGGDGRSRLDASISIGEGVPGESVTLRMYNELADHAESVVGPLLLPESPVVVWWPGAAPSRPSEHPIGRLGRRRVTDAAAATEPLPALQRYAHHYAPGDTDLSWTRITPWRALLAAALDQYPVRVDSAVIEAPRSTPSANLLAAWLGRRLKVPAEVTVSGGPGITAARLRTADGEIAITRPDGVLARYAIPGQPERHVALKRRTTAELLAEELRGLVPDPTYAETVEELLR